MVEQSVSDAQLVLQAPPDTSDAAGLPIPLPRILPSRWIRQLRHSSGSCKELLPTPECCTDRSHRRRLERIRRARRISTDRDHPSGTHEATLAYVQRLRDLERLFVIEQIAIDVQPDATNNCRSRGAC